jgi:hypothetical protein
MQRVHFRWLAALAACAGCAILPAQAQSTSGARPRPAASAPASTDCDARWQAYRRSQACYAPFQNANGTLKPGAEAACGAPLLDPSPQCGPPRS